MSTHPRLNSYYTLGRTGLRVSRLALGVNWNLNWFALYGCYATLDYWFE